MTALGGDSSASGEWPFLRETAARGRIVQYVRMESELAAEIKQRGHGLDRRLLSYQRNARTDAFPVDLLRASGHGRDFP